MSNAEVEDINRINVGRIGEDIVANYMSSKGCCVKRSVNPYDSEKDMEVDGRKYEIKTQVPYNEKDSFVIDQSQYDKCSSVDWLVFVSIPDESREHYSHGKVYMGEQNEVVFDPYTMPDGREVLLIGIKQLKEVFTISFEEYKLLKKYSEAMRSSGGSRKTDYDDELFDQSRKQAYKEVFSFKEDRDYDGFFDRVREIVFNNKDLLNDNRSDDELLAIVKRIAHWTWNVYAGSRTVKRKHA